MNGIHDCGGMQCYGSVRYAPSEAQFHADWEARVAALNHASWYVKDAELPTFRSDIEGLDPVDYLRMSYWQVWFEALVRRLIAHGWVSVREVELGRSEKPATNGAVAASPAEAAAWLLKARHGARAQTLASRFDVGARVRARNLNPVGHTRLPRYVRGKVGVVTRHRGVWDFPDTDEYGLGANPNHVYAVRFSARDLWGEGASLRDFTYVDLWERYLESP